MSDDVDTKRLESFMRRMPAFGGFFAHGVFDSGCWWVKFTIDLDHALAWRLVQELGHILNYVSLNDRLPTVFMPVSPPVYANGGPKEFLSWVIEAKDTSFTPDDCAEWLEGRLPQPVDDLAQWELED